MKINEETGLYENYGLWHTPFWQTETFYFIVKLCMVIAVLIFCIVAYKIYVMRKKKKKLPAWDIALQNLQTLHAAQQVRSVTAKEFYLSLGSIVKTYLHDRFGYDVLSKTDDEVVAYLEGKQIEQDLVDDIRTLLQGSIIIKFANMQAAQEQMTSDYDRFFALIKKTIPQKK